MNRKEFMKAAHLDNTWNNITEYNGYKIGAVLWQDKPWKLVDTLEFDLISDRNDKTHILAEFKYQDELYQYINTL